MTTELDPWDRALLDAMSSEPEGGDLLALDELSAASGISLPLLEALAREGLLIPRTEDPEPLFDPTDADAVNAGLALVQAGLPLGELLALARRMDEAMRPVAEQAVEMFVVFVRDSVEAQAESDDEAAERLVTAFREMLPATDRLVGHHFRRLLLAHAHARLTEQ
jgi:hypothetical protein